MLTDVIEHLIKGDKKITDRFVNAQNKWNQILKDFDWDSPNALAVMTEIVYKQQIPFELLVGDRWLGQEIMVVVGIGQFYSVNEGFGENLKRAKLIREAFLLSYCSLEVKYYARQIENLYDLEDESDFGGAHFF